MAPRPWITFRRLAAACAAAAALSVAAQQEVPPIAPELGESVVFVRTRDLLPVELETTVFRPPGEGRFPVVMINHGKSVGRSSFQPRARYLAATREFLARGYAVVIPMRKGFSKSGGAVVGEGCNIAGAGEAQADDLHAVVAWLAQQPWADTDRMVMLGQSHGGLATLAYAQQPHPGFKLFGNFAGGLRYTGGCRWEQAMVDAFGRYGRKTRVPTLWFYGANDSFFPPPVIQPAFEAYVAAGAPGEMVAYGPFGSDSHLMFTTDEGVPVWWPRVEARLAAAGLPVAVVRPELARMQAPPQAVQAALPAAAAASSPPAAATAMKPSKASKATKAASRSVPAPAASARRKSQPATKPI